MYKIKNNIQLILPECFSITHFLKQFLIFCGCWIFHFHFCFIFSIPISFRFDLNFWQVMNKYFSYFYFFFRFRLFYLAHNQSDCFSFFFSVLFSLMLYRFFLFHHCSAFQNLVCVCVCGLMCEYKLFTCCVACVFCYRELSLPNQRERDLGVLLTCSRSTLISIQHCYCVTLWFYHFILFTVSMNSVNFMLIFYLFFFFFLLTFNFTSGLIQTEKTNEIYYFGMKVK